MKTKDLCATDVVTVNRFEELTSAAQLMRDKHIGYLVVVEPDLPSNALKPIGVLTDRDIVVAVVAQDVNPRSLTVGDVMTQQPITVTDETPIRAALVQMRRSGIRRLPVVDRNGKLTGVLSLDDVLDSLAAELQDVAGSIRNEQRIEWALRPGNQ